MYNIYEQQDLFDSLGDGRCRAGRPQVRAGTFQRQSKFMCMFMFMYMYKWMN